MSQNFPSLCLGSNVFGWTADRAQSYAVLDAARAAGLTFIDTADLYAAWAHGGQGGQSETIIGSWMAERAARDDIKIATKVGMLDGFGDIRPATIRGGLEGSLRRLQIDYIDLYYAHGDDDGDLAETIATFDALIGEGVIGDYGISNFSAERLAEVLAICASDGFIRPAALQPHYSLMERAFEDDLQGVAIDGGVAVLPYYALAGGFLTGKYRPGGAAVDSPRADGAAAYLNEPRGVGVLRELDAAAAAHDVPVGAVALAWLRAQPGVVAPVASARTVEQLEPLVASVGLELTPEELDALSRASSADRSATAS
jgi:aryl-alcohol dehydrogenase-like predicted oxidoreductase